MRFYKRRRLALVRTGDINMPMAWKMGAKVGGRRRLTRYRRYYGAAKSNRYRTKILYRKRRAGRTAAQSTRQHGQIQDFDNSAPADNQMATLHGNAVSFPTSAPGQIGGRVSSVINLRGIRVCEEFHNTCPFSVELHYAIVRPKDNDIIFTELPEMFFRNTVSGTQRSETFLSKPSAYRFFYRCAGINPDKFDVITHTTHTLDPVNLLADPVSGSDDRQPIRNSKWKVKIDRYLRLNKQVNFNDSTGAPMRPFYTVWWWMPILDQDYDASDNPSLKLTRYYKHDVYFRNGAA